MRQVGSVNAMQHFIVCSFTISNSHIQVQAVTNSQTVTLGSLVDKPNKPKILAKFHSNLPLLLGISTPKNSLSIMDEFP